MLTPLETLERSAFAFGLVVLLVFLFANAPGCTIESEEWPGRMVHSAPDWQVAQCRKLCEPAKPKGFKARYTGHFECWCGARP